MQFLITAIVSLAMLAGIEGASWAWLKFRVGETSEVSSQEFDLYTDYRLKALPEGFIFDDGHPCLPARSKFRIDTNGLHTPSAGLTLEKPEGEIRVALFGGSTMFGIGVLDTDHTIAAALERKLKEHNSKIRVINAGMRGYLSFQEFQLYWSRIAKFNPDIVVSFTGFNDGQAAFTKGEQGPLRSWHQYAAEKKVDAIINGASQPAGALLSQLAAKTSTARAFDLLLRRYVGVAEDSKPATIGDFDQQWAKVRAETFVSIQQDFKAIVERRGTVFISAFQPSLYQRHEPSDRELDCANRVTFEDNAHRYEVFTENVFKEAAAWPWMHDLRGLFEDTPDVYIDAVHLNDRGQAAVADAIFGVLEKDPRSQAVLGAGVK